MEKIDYSPNLPDMTFQDKLRIQLKSIKNWESLSNFEKEHATAIFMKTIGCLFLEYFQYNLQEAKAIATEFSKEIAWAVRLINLFYIYRLDSRISSSDIWEDMLEPACRAMTNIEAFQAMFGDFAGELDADAIWEFLEERKDNYSLPPEVIPKNVPKSHWWWFADYNPKWNWKNPIP